MNFSLSFFPPGNWRDLSYMHKNTNNFNIHNIAKILALEKTPEVP